MPNIRYISTSTVRLATDDDHCEELTHMKIELTPWDLRTLPNNYMQKGLLFRKPPPPSTALSDHHQLSADSFIQHLKTTLSQTLNVFFPLAGRLALVENDDGSSSSSFFLDCNNDGVEFVHAAADDVSVDDILKPLKVPDDIIHSLFLLNGVSNYLGTSKPLLALQVTELVDGVFVAYAANHSVLDGTSMWHFLNTWTDISRRGGCCSGPPDFGRGFLRGIVDLPVRIPPSFIDKLTDDSEKFIPPPLQQRIFRFSKEKIAELKAKANAGMCTTKISSLQALLAHLWVSITRSRRYLKADEEVSVGVALSMRQRMEPAVPEKYFGSTVVTQRVSSGVGELLQKGSAWAAWEINKSIGSFTSIEMRKFAEDWAKNPVITKLARRSGNSLFVGSSPRFDVYGNDFGWGKPLAVRSGPSNKFDGKLTVFQGLEEGGMDFEACLLPETMEALAEDVEFMETLTVT